MKLLFDQNLSYRLMPALESLYPGSVHIRDVGLAMADDETGCYAGCARSTPACA
jgi:predicted nuclease of predicted toxin-antitoxin system